MLQSLSIIRSNKILMNEQYKQDLRYIVAKHRLSQLTDEELIRIIENIDNLCYDTFNYDKKENKYCPISTAMNLHNTIQEPTNEKIREAISERFDPPNIFKGIRGNFYRENRREDLLNLVNEILKKRNKKINNGT
jgi:hypothetical protein